MGELMDLLGENWTKYAELIDPDFEFGDRVAAILVDNEDDKLGRINDLHYSMLEACAKYAIECDQWFGVWGALKNDAGFPNYYSFKEAA
jgi:hypothetical protein